MLQLPGCVALPRHASLRMPVRKQDVRGALTYVSIICDAPHIQGKLPHYLFGTETKLTQKLLRGQRRLPQTALHIVRQKSAWTSCKNITKIVRDLGNLGKVLKPYPFQPILLLDVASSHLAKETMVCARRNGVQLLYIPAGCTDKIQSLYIAGFHPFKAHLKRKYQELRAGSCEGLIDPLAWLFELMQCPSYFAGKSWKRTFESVGAAKPPDTPHLHTDLRKFMDMPLHMPPGSKPSKEALQSIWPERRRMAYAYTALLWRGASREKNCAEEHTLADILSRYIGAWPFCHILVAMFLGSWTGVKRRYQASTKENTGSPWGLHAVWVEQACCLPALSAMSAADANAAAAAAPPAAADRIAVLKEERKTLKRQLAAATKELQNQESACRCMDTVSFRECRWDMWTLNPCWKTCTP